MAYYRRGYYRRGRSGYGYRGYNRSWRRRGWYRRGVARAQATGDRRFKLIVPLSYTFSMTVPAGQTVSPVYGTNPYCDNTANGYNLRCICSLPSSEIYRTYCRLYDEVKIDWVSMNMTCMENIGANLPALSVITGLDRCCSANEVSATVGTEWPSASQLIGSGTSQRYMMNSLTKKSVYRSIRATDINERSIFHDCDIATVNSGSVSITADNAYYHMGTTAHACLFFAPAFQFAVELPTAAPDGGYAVVFQMEVKYGVTFRGPKYGMVASGNSKTVPVEIAGKSVAKSVSFDAGAVSDLLSSYTGLLGDVVDRLNVAKDDPSVYSDGEYNLKEDIEFAYGKLGDEKFRELFNDNYDLILKELGLINDVSKEA